MHIAQFYLYNSYIPQKFRKIIRDYYAINSNQSNASTNATTQGEDGFLADASQGSRYDLKFNYLVNDDFQLGIQNEFGRITNLVGMENLGPLPALVRTGANVQKPTADKEGVKTNANVQNLNNLFNYAVWQKTNPLTVNFSIVLYAKTDPLIDVVIPAYALMSHCIIDFVKENKDKSSDYIYGFPGLTAFEATKIGQVYDRIKINEGVTTNNNNGEGGKFNSKLMSLYIDGVVNLNLAMIKNITPTFSKHTAKSSYVSQTSNNGSFTNNEFEGDYPIYAELNIQIESIIPADSNMLWGGVLNDEKRKGNISKIPENTSITTDANSTK